jgi:type IV secretion system protein VirD4
LNGKIAVAAVGLLIMIGVWDMLTATIFVHVASINIKPGPLTVWRYWSAYHNNHAVAVRLYGSMAGAGVACLAPIVFIIVLAREKLALYGAARWAKKSEIRKVGLMSERGILVGRHKGDYLMLDGHQHVMLAAPTRSGKGVSVVIPNCLQWPDSMVILDIKQENWNITSGFRARHGQDCFLFNPGATDYRSHRWNPLGYVGDDAASRIDDIQKIAGFVYPDTQGADPIWAASCRSLFLGIALYLLESDGLPVTLGEVLRQATKGDAKRFARIIAEREEEGDPLSAACIGALHDYLDTSTNTRTSIRKTFTSRLELWMNPVLDAATAANDFDLRELRQKRMSIYIGITPDNLERLAPVINLFLQQVIDLNTRAMPKRGDHDVLLLMDEFAAVGKIPALKKGVAYMAGYNLRMLPIFQTPAQLKDTELYGPEGARTLMDNHALKIVFAPNNMHDAKEISEELGTQTVTSTSRSRPDIFTKGTKSHSESDQRRELLLPQEVKDIGKKREIILMEGCRPIMADKVRYFEDSLFMDRLKAISPSLNGSENKFPTEDELVAAATSGELADSVPMLEQVGQTESTLTAADVAAAAGGKSLRDVEAADLDKLDGMKLSDFDVDTGDIEVPTEDMDDAAISRIADQFYDAFA